MTPARLREIAFGATAREWADADEHQADHYGQRWEADRPARAATFATAAALIVLFVAVFGRFW